MVQIQQNIEHGRDTTQPGCDVIAKAVANTFQIADDSDHGESSFDKHTLVPGAFLAQVHIGWDAVLAAKAVIGKDDAGVRDGFSHMVKVLVVCIHAIPGPTDHTAILVQQPAELDSNRPPPFIPVFLANLLGTAPFADWKQQLNRIGVDDGEQRGIRQQQVQPITMRLQGPLQARAIRQPGEQGVIIPFQPPIEGPEVTPFQGKQQPDGHQLTRIKFGLGMLLHAWHSIIDFAKDMNDNVFSSHGSCPFLLLDTSRMHGVRDFFN